MEKSSVFVSRRGHLIWGFWWENFSRLGSRMMTLWIYFSLVKHTHKKFAIHRKRRRWLWWWDCIKRIFSLCAHANWNSYKNARIFWHKRVAMTNDFSARKKKSIIEVHVIQIIHAFTLGKLTKKEKNCTHRENAPCSSRLSSRRNKKKYFSLSQKCKPIRQLKKL